MTQKPRKIKLAPKATHDVARALMEWRKAKGWTRKQAAEELGINHRTLEGWEYGRRKPPSFKLLEKLWAERRRPQ
jgi:DNA-binding transcriptional regulator YiaG